MTSFKTTHSSPSHLLPPCNATCHVVLQPGGPSADTGIIQNQFRISHYQNDKPNKPSFLAILLTLRYFVTAKRTKHLRELLSWYVSSPPWKASLVSFPLNRMLLHLGQRGGTLNTSVTLRTSSLSKWWGFMYKQLFVFHLMTDRILGCCGTHGLTSNFFHSQRRAGHRGRDHLFWKQNLKVSLVKSAVFSCVLSIIFNNIRHTHSVLTFWWFIFVSWGHLSRLNHNTFQVVLNS